MVKMSLEELKNKAIRGEAIGNGDIIIAVDQVFQQTLKTNGRVSVIEPKLEYLEKAQEITSQTLKDLADGKIKEAARKQGLMLLPKIGWRVITFVGGPTIITGLIFLWHLADTVDSTKKAIREHNDTIANIQKESQLNQKAILTLLNSNQTHNQNVDTEAARVRHDLTNSQLYKKKVNE